MSDDLGALVRQKQIGVGLVVRHAQAQRLVIRRHGVRTVEFDQVRVALHFATAAVHLNGGGGGGGGT